MSVTARIKHEILEAIPAIVFFLIAFHVIWITRALMAEQYGVTLTGTAGATVAALIIGKVILIADKLPFVNRFPDKPLIYNVLWKTAIYVVAALFLRYIEHLIHFWRQHGDFASANRHLLDELPWPHFWAVQIWLATLLLVYCALREFVRGVGPRRVIDMFFRKSAAPSPAG